MVAFFNFVIGDFNSRFVVVVFFLLTGDEYLPRPKNDSFSSIESDDDDVIDDVEL